MNLTGLLVIALLSTVTTAQDGKDGGSQTTNYCKTLGYLKIFVASGSCSGLVSANCKAAAEAQNSIVQGFDEWYGEAGPGLCETGRAEATAKAHSKALAEVWASGLVDVLCDGEGFACGWVLANVKSWSVAFAKATAQAAAEVSAKQADGQGLCFADIEALSTVFAKAASKAKGDTCSYGGDLDPVKFMQNTFARAIQIGVAEAYARAAARACNDNKLKASSKCGGRATTLDGIGSETVHGGNLSQTEVGNLDGCGDSTATARSTTSRIGCVDDTTTSAAPPPKAPKTESTDADGCGSSKFVGRSAGGCTEEEPARIPETPAPSPQEPSETEPSDVDECERSKTTERSASGCGEDDATTPEASEVNPVEPSETESSDVDECESSKTTGRSARSGSNCVEDKPEATSPPPPPPPSPIPSPSPSRVRFLRENTPGTPELIQESTSAANDGDECTGEVKRKCCVGRSVPFCMICRGCAGLRRDRTTGTKLTWKFVNGTKCFCG